MSRDYRLRVSSPYFLYLYVQKYKIVASVGPWWPWARVPCTLCTPYCYATGPRAPLATGLLHLLGYNPHPPKSRFLASPLPVPMLCVVVYEASCVSAGLPAWPVSVSMCKPCYGHAVGPGLCQPASVCTTVPAR